MAYKSLIRRLGYICGLCGHQSGSSVSLLKHLGNQHNEHWPQATTYAEWLQTDSALRNLGCSCLRPPTTPHVCTVYTQLALFVHHDLTRLHGGSDVRTTRYAQPLAPGVVCAGGKLIHVTCSNTCGINMPNTPTGAVCFTSTSPCFK